MSAEITVVCGVRGRFWTRAGKLALDSVRRQSPGVATRLVGYSRGGRFDALADVETPWACMIDADVVCLGDIRPVPIRHGRADVIARRGTLHGLDAWEETRWRALLETAGLPYCMIVWNGVFFARRDVARVVADRLPHWRRWYLKHGRGVLAQGHKKQDQVGLTMTLAETGARVYWAGPDLVTWQGHEEPAGLFHHFSGVRLRRMAQNHELRELYDRTELWTETDQAG